MPSKNNFKLPDGIFSSDDLRSVIRELEAYRRWYSHHSIKIRFSKKRNFNEPELSTPAKQALSDWLKGQELKVSSLNQLLSNLAMELKKAKRVSVTLAAIPSGQLKHQITSWFRVNISPGVLVDFRANATILGGMIVIFGSHVYDLSTRSRLLESRDKLREVITRV